MDKNTSYKERTRNTLLASEYSTMIRFAFSSVGKEALHRIMIAQSPSPEDIEYVYSAQQMNHSWFKVHPPNHRVGD